MADSRLQGRTATTGAKVRLLSYNVVMDFDETKYREQILETVDAVINARMAYMHDVNAGQLKKQYPYIEKLYYTTGEFTVVFSSPVTNDVYIVIMPIDLDSHGNYGQGFLEVNSSWQLWQLRRILEKWVVEQVARLEDVLCAFDCVSHGYRLPNLHKTFMDNCSDDSDWWKK